MTVQVRIQPFDFSRAVEPEFKIFNDVTNALRLEKLPDDPPVPLSETIALHRNLPDSVRLRLWLAREGERVAGYAFLAVPLKENRHMGQFDIGVLPENRRRGLGSRLLAEIAAAAQAEAREILIAVTTGNVPAGGRFLERIGAEPGLQARTSQLRLAEVDREQLAVWRNRAAERAGGFKLGWWFGPYPQEDLAAILELNRLVNQVPRGDLDVEDFIVDEDELRQEEQGFFARGSERWTVYAREISSGRFAGYSVTTWNPNRPEVVSQGMTGVFPEHRGRDLGRWLKAAMLEKVLADRPEARFVRTFNADSNAPMRKLNEELGFELYFNETTWQVRREVVERYLQEGSSPVR